MTKSTQIAAAPTMSPADINAHRAASYVRPTRITPTRAGFGICGFCGKPDVAGHACANLTPTGAAALGRLEVWAAHVLRDRQTTETTSREMADAA